MNDQTPTTTDRAKSLLREAIRRRGRGGAVPLEATPLDYETTETREEFHRLLREAQVRLWEPGAVSGGVYDAEDAAAELQRQGRKFRMEIVEGGQ